MILKKKTVGLALILGLAQIASPAMAGPIDFDCDVSKNRSSSISNQNEEPLEISGILRPVELRSDQYLPTAGVYLDDTGSENFAMFRITAASDQSEKLEVTVSVKNGNKTHSEKIGMVGRNDSITFSLTTSDEGIIHFIIAGLTFDYESMFLASRKERVFCSAGQFKFSELLFQSAQKQ